MNVPTLQDSSSESGAYSHLDGWPNRDAKTNNGSNLESSEYLNRLFEKLISFLTLGFFRTKKQSNSSFSISESGSGLRRSEYSKAVSDIASTSRNPLLQKLAKKMQALKVAENSLTFQTDSKTGEIICKTEDDYQNVMKKVGLQKLHFKLECMAGMIIQTENVSRALSTNANGETVTDETLKQKQEAIKKALGESCDEGTKEALSTFLSQFPFSDKHGELNHFDSFVPALLESCDIEADDQLIQALKQHCGKEQHAEQGTAKTKPSPEKAKLAKVLKGMPAAELARLKEFAGDGCKGAGHIKRHPDFANAIQPLTTDSGQISY